MKKNKILKTLGLFGCAILLVAVSIAGTMAYMTSLTGTVTNTFTAGKVEITLDETPVNLYGEAQSGDRVTANEYKLIPGHEYVKDPTIHVAKGSEKCYLFVKVENGIAAIEAKDTTEAKTSIAAQLEANGWVALENGVYYYNNTVDAREAAKDVTVFEDFTIADDANVTGYATEGNANSVIKVTAYAIQADGFSDAATAWAAAPAAWN